MKQHPLWHILLVALAVTCTALLFSLNSAAAQEEKPETPAAAEKAETPAATPAAEEKTGAPASEVKTESPAAETKTEAPVSEVKTEVSAETSTAELSDEEKAKAEEEKAKAEKAAADAAPIPTKTFTYVVNSVVMFLCAVLVLMMQGGFALVEIGLNSAKNAANILAKNLMDLCIGAILFLLFGFGLMYPGAANMNESKTFGFAGIGLGGLGTKEVEVDGKKTTVIDGDAENLDGNYAPAADFMFQVAFAATAATIVSGAVAGRLSFLGYLIYTAVITGFVYPVSGMWKWGLGWLDAMGFQDFAGSIIVHSVGGFAGLAGAMLLGPRIGRYVNGKSIPMPGHNIVYAGLGVFLLWVGWYGFNPGSQLTYASTVEVSHTIYIAVTTTIAACAGAIIAMTLVWVMFGKPDVSMMLNGALAGLVGITANCNNVTLLSSIIIGGIAGVIVVLGVILLDKLKIDDPVGAFPVHGMCGVWGGIATGIFGVNIPAAAVDRMGFIKVQLIGTVTIGAWAFFTMILVFGILKMIGLLRVSPEHELEGLDIAEHGMHAYPPSWVAADDFGAGPAGTSPAMYSKSAPVHQVEVSPSNA